MEGHVFGPERARDLAGLVVEVVAEQVEEVHVPAAQRGVQHRHRLA